MKSNLKSIELRSEGNKLYSQKKFEDALLKYNESLCFAEDDEHLALVYANRSAVYMEMKMYQQCLNNIRLAKEHNYPEEKLVKLLERETRCLELMMQATSINSEPFDFFKLSYKANPKIPFIIDDLELKTNAKYGRHIVTKRDLKVGDIIFIEKSFFGNIQSDKIFDENVKPWNIFNFCKNCLKENNLDLIPCESCNVTMFCSDECKKSAQSYYKYECKNSEIFQSSSNYTQFRSFFKALAIMDGSIETLEKLFEECLKSPKTIFDFDFSDPNDPDYAKNQLSAALCLARDTSLKKDSSINYLLALCPQYKQTWAQKRSFFEKFILHLKQVDQFCLGNVEKNLPFLSGLYYPKILIGTANFLIGNLINHSCWPNVETYTSGVNTAAAVIRPIKAGQQIFSCYYGWFQHVPIMKRQEVLFKSWKIKCDCEACSDPLRYQVVEKLASLPYTFAPTSEQFDTQNLVSMTLAVERTMQKMYETQEFPTNEYLTAFAFLDFLFFLISQKS